MKNNNGILLIITVMVIISIMGVWMENNDPHLKDLKAHYYSGQKLMCSFGDSVKTISKRDGWQLKNNCLYKGKQFVVIDNCIQVPSK